MVLWVSFDAGSIIGWVHSAVKWRKERIIIKKPHLSRPDLVNTYNPHEGITDSEEALPFEFGLSFRFENKTPQSVNDCSYAVVIEHTTTGPTSDRVTVNFPGELEDYNGLTEPQLSPVIIRTDLDEYVRFVSEDLESRDSGRLNLNDEINIRIKVTAEEVTADQYEFSLHRLMNDWVNECAGLDMRSFADDPTSFEENLDELPKMTVKEDVGTDLRRFR